MLQWEHQGLAKGAHSPPGFLPGKGDLVVGTGTKGRGEAEGRSHNRTRMCWYTGQKWEWSGRAKGWESHGVKTLPCHLKITAVDPDKVLLVKQQQ